MILLGQSRQLFTASQIFKILATNCNVLTLDFICIFIGWEMITLDLFSSPLKAQRLVDIHLQILVQVNLAKLHCG